MPSITFIVLVGNQDTYQKCFLSSPLFQAKDESFNFQIIPQSGFRTAADALNDGIERAENNLIACVHQDVILPVTWMSSFLAGLGQVESLGVPVGVVGCWGITSEGEKAGHVYHRDRQLFPRKPGDNGNRGAMSLPMRVQTLDELLIAFRKSTGLRFDPALPSFFGYAVDLCLEAEARGFQNFSIDCPCVHQTVDQRGIRKELFLSEMFLMNKWKGLLPIQVPTGPLEGKFALWRNRMKAQLQVLLGYNPQRMWWEDLPQVDLATILVTGTTTNVDPQLQAQRLQR
jgi:hypothetical protein